MADDPATHARFRAPGGWRRALLGFLVGIAAGLAVALVLPRDDGPRRRHVQGPLPEPPLEPPGPAASTRP